jgi:tetratricopeptide (TPR) repeat protein
MAASYRVCAPLLAALVFGMLAGCGGADTRRASHLARGQQYLAQDKLEKARVEFADALQIAPNDAEARFLSGRVAEKLGDLRAAGSLYQGALDVNPDHVQACVSLARLYLQTGSPEKALGLVEPLLGRHPDDPDLLTARGAARAQRQEGAAALADVQRAVQLAPAHEAAVSVLAVLYQQAGQPERAVELLTTTLKRLPNSGELHRMLAQLYLAEGDNRLAEEQLRQVVQSSPRQLAPRLQLAAFFIRGQRLDEAERTLKEATTAGSDGDEAKLLYADFLATHRSLAQAESTLRDLIAQDPRNYDLRLGLGAMQQRAGAAKDAVATYRGVIAADSGGPKGYAARDRIAAIDAGSGNYEEAFALIGEALRGNPRDDDALTLRGNIRLARGDPLGAIADLRAVLRDQPLAVPILRSLARAHLANGESGIAEENLRAARAAAPGDVAVRVDLAQLLARTRRGDEAVALLEETVKLTPDASGTPARVALVQAYLAKADFAAARTAATDLQTLRPELAIGSHLAGLVAQQQKRPEDAQREFEHALQLQPLASDTLAALARLELERGQRAQAFALVQDAVQRAPDSAPIRNLLGELFVADQNYREALTTLSEAVRLAPSWWVPYRNLATAQFAANNPAGALAAYQAGVKATAEPTLVIELAAVYERQGRIDDAIQQYETLHQRNPNLELAANNLAMLLVTYRTDQASLDRARDLSAPFANSYVSALLDTRGWVMFKRGDVLQALTALEKAAAGAPDSQVIRYHLGMAEFRAGQRDRARTDLESALSGSARFSGAEEARQTLASLKTPSSG